MIRHTADQKVAYRIPSDLLNLEVDNIKSFNAAKIIASKMWFDSDDHLRIINK